MITLQGRLRRNSAIRSASHTSVAVIRSDTDQPTTLRENRSSTTARYSQPSSVAMSVIDLVRPLRREVLLQQALFHRQRVVGVRRRLEFPRRLRPQALSTQALCHLTATASKVSRQARRTCSPLASLELLPHLRFQHCTGLGLLRRRTAPPRVVPAAPLA